MAAASGSQALMPTPAPLLLMTMAWRLILEADVDEILLQSGQIERTIAAFALHVAIQANTNDDSIRVLGRRKIGNLRGDQGHSYANRPPPDHRRDRRRPPPRPPRPAGALARARAWMLTGEGLWA